MTDFLLILSHILALYLGYRWGRFLLGRKIKKNLYHRIALKGGDAE